ncbi:MAG: hypothetical protein V3W04_00710 [Gammaproteobacteria bacterium]
MDSLTTFQELGRSYYKGILSFDEYRDQRRRMINQLTTDASTLTEPATLEQKKTERGINKWFFGILFLMLLIGLVFLLLLRFKYNQTLIF